jgi:hypothetical protein
MGLMAAAAAVGRPRSALARPDGAGRIAPGRGARQPDPAAVAWALNAAWNAHDVEGLVALFAPDAEVWQTRVVLVAADSSEAALAIEDVYGAGQGALADTLAARNGPQGEVLWAAGTPRIRAWLLGLFAAGHRVEASAYEADGDSVAWRFRAFADPYQRFPGVEPTEGTARLAVHDGRVAALTFGTERHTVTRRTRQFDAATQAATRARIAVTRSAPPRPATPSRRGAGPAAAAPAGPAGGLPLSLVGAAALGSFVLIRRRRVRPEGRRARI